MGRWCPFQHAWVTEKLTSFLYHFSRSIHIGILTVAYEKPSNRVQSNQLQKSTKCCLKLWNHLFPSFFGPQNTSLQDRTTRIEPTSFFFRGSSLDQILFSKSSGLTFFKEKAGARKVYEVWKLQELDFSLVSHGRGHKMMVHQGRAVNRC